MPEQYQQAGMPQEYPQQQYPEQYARQMPEQYQQSGMPQEYSQQYMQPPQNSGMMSEVAEQLIEEKISTMKKSLESLEELKTIAGKKIENLDIRMKAMEDKIDKLVSAILGKVGDYGDSIIKIKDEMAMMQDSFSKMINPVLDKKEETSSEREVVRHQEHHTQASHPTHHSNPAHHSEHHNPTHHPTHHTPEKKKRAGIEHFLRR